MVLWVREAMVDILLSEGGRNGRPTPECVDGVRDDDLHSG
jgi:hypothetical protein